jgi:hypothetical protein
MGIFDEIKRAIDPRRPDAGRPAPAPSPASGRGGKPGVAALEAAQQKRRAKGATKKNGKPATTRDLRHYETLERSLVLRSGAFPLDAATTRAELLRRGFDPQHVEAYLASDAARKLLE